MKSAKRPWGIALACILICAVALAAAMDAKSELADSLRFGAPLIGSVWTRFEGQGRVVAPEVYVLLYTPATGRLEIISAPSSSPAGRRKDETLADVYGRVYAAGGDVRRASRAMAAEALNTIIEDPAWPPGTRAPSFQLELAATPAPSDTAEIKARLVAWYCYPLFWARLLGALTTLSPEQAPGLSRYDALLLAWTLHRINPDRIGLSRMPSPEAAAAFLARALGRAAEPNRGPITVEVLNASGSGGIALKATKILRWHGIDVVSFGNAPTRQDSTRFIDKIGLPGYARSAMENLGCPDAPVLTEMEGQPRASVTAVLGRDFTRCAALRD